MPWDRDDYYSSHPDFPIEDWKREVANDNTRLSYVAWVDRCVEYREEADRDGNFNGGI